VVCEDTVTRNLLPKFTFTILEIALIFLLKKFTNSKLIKSKKHCILKTDRNIAKSSKCELLALLSSVLRGTIFGFKLFRKKILFKFLRLFLRSQK